MKSNPIPNQQESSPPQMNFKPIIPFEPYLFKIKRFQKKELVTKILKDFLINFARPFIYSTAPSTWHVSSLLATLGFIKNQDSLRQKLQANIQFFQNTKNAKKENSIVTEVRKTIARHKEELATWKDKLKQLKEMQQ